MGIMSGAANDRWREAQKECEILEHRLDEANAELARLRSDRDSVVQAFEAAERVAAAQLAELHAISEALGTNEGHSSVDHIARLRSELAAALSERDALMAGVEQREAELAAARKLCGEAAEWLQTNEDFPDERAIKFRLLAEAAKEGEE